MVCRPHGGLGAQVQRQVRNLGIGDRAFRPVTDAMLEKPEPGEWINWRRTYDGTGLQPADADQQTERRPA